MTVIKFCSFRNELIHLVDVSPTNLNLFRRLNQTIFPICYNEKFYRDIFNSNIISKLGKFDLIYAIIYINLLISNIAYYYDKNVKNVVMAGAVCSKIDLTNSNGSRLYIMTLGCLPSYRRLGIASKLLNYILDYAHNVGNFDNVYLHVQTNNQEAILFYRKFGFEVVNTVLNYYRRIQSNPDAYVLEKKISK